ncbi:MAG: beta-propeller domain-containing protein, partial [Lachnospiraceae bacterium]|nr:beta-propeller domain-containing protein [Lachnospiraceae bacterium]
MASNFTGKYYEENWEEHNALYVLDKDMRQIGSLDGLADNETIRSARFFGDTGYFVTFRQTDPLFSVDLSDPSDPKILGELKVSGFSSYLHFYGENMLLGIGYEANEETGVVTGLKLSMFDISDPSNVTEVSRFVIPGITWCPAIESYKSILVDPEKNLIGFFCDNRYLLFSYEEEEGFQSKLVYDFYSDMLLDQVSYDTLRGLYIDNTFYIAGNTFVISFDMKKDFKKTNVLQIS